MRFITNRLKALRREDGIALPVVMGVMSVMLLLIVVAANDSGKANDAANHDRGSTRALQGADSALEAAIYRLNTLDVMNRSDSEQCVAVALETQQISRQAYGATSGGRRWCPPVHGTLADGTSYTYWVSDAVDLPDNGGITRTVIAQSTDGGVTRQASVELTARSESTPLFGTGTIISLENFIIGGGTFVNGNVQSNGNIRLDGSARICGDATPGPGRAATWTGAGSYQCGGSRTPAPGPVTLPPVDLAQAANNDNSRICASSNPATSDPCSGKSSWQVHWEPAKRRLDVMGNSHITLGGNLYFFCYFRVTNGARVIIAPRNPSIPVRIYIDSPQNCPNTNPKGTFEVINDGKIENPYGAPALQFYVAGNTANPAQTTQIELANSGGVGMPMLVYAPNSPVRISGVFAVHGAVAARLVKIEGSGGINSHPDAGSVTTGGSGATSMLQPGIYRECSVSSSTPVSDPPPVVPPAGC
jgi:hypothetical protein